MIYFLLAAPFIASALVLVLAYRKYKNYV